MLPAGRAVLEGDAWRGELTPPVGTKIAPAASAMTVAATCGPQPGTKQEPCSCGNGPDGRPASPAALPLAVQSTVA
jgi:hypothetical protein